MQPQVYPTPDTAVLSISCVFSETLHNKSSVHYNQAPFYFPRYSTSTKLQPISYQKQLPPSFQTLTLKPTSRTPYQTSPASSPEHKLHNTQPSSTFQSTPQFLPPYHFATHMKNCSQFPCFLPLNFLPTQPKARSPYNNVAHPSPAQTASSSSPSQGAHTSPKSPPQSTHQNNPFEAPTTQYKTTTTHKTSRQSPHRAFESKGTQETCPQGAAHLAGFRIEDWGWWEIRLSQNVIRWAGIRHKVCFEHLTQACLSLC